MGNFKKAISFIGTVFDIHDTISLIRWLFSAGGLAAIVVGVVNWIGDNVPSLSLYLFGFGAFSAFTVVLPNIYRRFNIGSRKCISQDISIPLWLEQVLAGDMFNIGKHIHVVKRNEGKDWAFDGLKKTEPYVMVKLEVINANCFPIVITGMDGSLNIEGSQCNHDIRMHVDRKQILHGESAIIKLFQRISRETMDKMSTLTNERGGFMVDFNTCHFLVHPDVDGEENNIGRVDINIRENVRL